LLLESHLRLMVELNRQAGKQGAVVDERFNGGGTNTDYILDYLRRTLMNFRTTRDGEDMTTPVSLIAGPKAMIINEYAGSGGDAMPWHFRQAQIGQLVGKRTWGGLAGFYGPSESLMDGGTVTAPSRGFWTPTTNGRWRTKVSRQKLKWSWIPKPCAKATIRNSKKPSSCC
jgi:tricorn protease